MDFNAGVIRHVCFPLMEKLKNNEIRANLTYLQRTQKLSPAQIKNLQAEKLTKLLLHCLQEVPAYADQQQLKDAIVADPMTALTSFPVLTKKIFIANADDYLAQGVDTTQLIANRTGGSTGEPVRFYLDRKTVEFFEAARWRGLSWWGVHIGDRSAMIWGSPIELNNQQQLSYRLKERYLKNRIVIPAYNLNPAAIRQYMDSLNNFRPKYFYGYASALHVFAEMMLSAGVSLNFRPQAVVSTAETLHDFQRKKIEHAFGCPAVNEYGARDGGIIAYECPQGHMHQSAENALIEIVDMTTYQPVEPGQTGLILVTDLNNFVMPRLRYALGDVGALAPEPCPCGIGLPVLAKIQGREDDTFVTANGSLVHGHFVNHIARNLTGIHQFQLIQHSPTSATLKIVQKPNFSQEELDFFLAEIRKMLGPIEVKVAMVDSIPTSSSGKIRYAKRDFPLEIH